MATPSTPLQTYSRWDDLPAHLTTKSRLDKAGLKPGPVRARIEYGKGRRHRVYDLYDVGEATPKQQATPAQLAALQRGRETVERNRQAAIDAALRAEQEFHDAARDGAILWSRELLAASDWVVLDTETTGLGDDAEIIQLGILRPDGALLFDAVLRPADPIPSEATAIHGITNTMVERAATFAEVYPYMSSILSGKRIITYNRDFDLRMWRQTQRRYGLPKAGTGQWGCAMLMYAAYYGEWSDYHADYRWQPLPGGNHTALGDASATLELIKEMAAARLSSEFCDLEAEELAVEAHALRLEQDGRHPDDDPAQYMKVT